MKLYEISKTDFDNFSIRNKIRNFYQTSEYGDWMEKRGYKCIYLGFLDNKRNLYAATLIIYKYIFANYKYGYAPRGFLINYNNEDLLKDFTHHLKLFLKAREFAYLKIDPPIVYKSRDKKGNFRSGRDSKELMSRLKKLGYEHLGFNTYFESLKPRWNAVIPLNKNLNDIKQSFNKEVRNKINNAIRKGIEIYKGNESDIEIVYKFIKNKYDRPISYYEDYYSIFKKRNMIDIYLAKLSVYTFLEKTQKAYEKELEKNDVIVRKMMSSNNNSNLTSKKINSDNLLNTYKQDIIKATNTISQGTTEAIIAGAIIIKYNRQTQILIDGIDEKYKSFNPNHLIKLNIINDAIERKDYYIDLNGIVGNFEKMNNPFYGLNQNKLGFAADVVEYIGEFNLPINPLVYGIIEKASGLGFINNIGTNKK